MHLLLVACSGPHADPDTLESDADTDTDDSGTGVDTAGDVPSISASCALQADNALRADCAVTVAPAGPVTVTFAPAGGGAPRAVSSPAVAAAHAVTLLRMVEGTLYDWTATADASGVQASGQVTTGALPPAAQVALDVTVTGAAPAQDDLLFPIECDTNEPTAVVVDADGEVVWYQNLATGLAGRNDVLMLVYTPDGEIAAVLNRERVRRFALDGTLLLDLERFATPGFDKVVHHDLFVRDDHTYVLNAEQYRVGGDDYVLDGVYVFDGAGALLAEWELADDVTPTDPGVGIGGYWGTVFPGASDWSHANGLYVDEDLDLYVSLFELDTVVKLVGDPADPAFGERVWVLDGSGAAPWPADFSLTDPLGLTSDLTFAHQHHPSLLPSGNLMLFDNEEVGNARAIELSLDLAAGEAAFRGSWSLGVTCPIEGGAFELSNGNVLATCATRGTFYELDRATGAVVRTIEPTCGAYGSTGLVARAVPVDL